MSIKIVTTCACGKATNYEAPYPHTNNMGDLIWPDHHHECPVCEMRTELVGLLETNESLIYYTRSQKNPKYGYTG